MRPYLYKFLLNFQCVNLKAQVEKQMEELHVIKQQIALPCRSHNDENRRNKSSAEARAAQRLIQRVISAARLAASQNSRTSHERQMSHFNKQSQDATQNELKRTENGVRDDCPEIYLESDIDGLCYLGPRSRSLRDDNNNGNNGNPGIR